jgi:hypothetical protein
LLAALGGAAVAWPLAARAQQGERVRRIGVLMGLADTDPGTMHNVQELRLALQGLGWIEGQNVQLAIRYAAGDPNVRGLSSWRFRPRKTGICGWSTPGSDAAKVVLLGEVLKLRWRGPTPPLRVTLG